MKVLIILIVFCVTVSAIWQYIQNRFFHRYEIRSRVGDKSLYRGSLKQCQNALFVFNNRFVYIYCIYPKRKRNASINNDDSDFIDSGHGFGMNVNGTPLKY